MQLSRFEKGAIDRIGIAGDVGERAVIYQVRRPRVGGRGDDHRFFAQIAPLSTAANDVQKKQGTSSFDAGLEDAPLTTSQPSRGRHLGFVVDHLEHDYARLKAHADRLASDVTLLGWDEGRSL